MPVRRKGQSQLDYLWENFARLQRLELNNNILTGIDEEGKQTQLQIQFSSSSVSSGSSNDVIAFGKEVTDGILKYYIELKDGTKFSVEADSPDLSELKLQVQSNLESLKVISDKLDVINGTDQGSLQNVLQQAKDYTDSKLINLDVTQLTQRVDDISKRLTTLEEDRQDILQIVQREINSALEWENL